MATPRKIGPYEVVSLIGRGGMGVVYRARDPRLGRSVAIKATSRELSRDLDEMARFHREARMLAALNHPNIAAIYGMEEQGGLHFLVLELVEGSTLRRHLAGQPLALDETLDICIGVARAIEAAHARGIVHRDLKPENIKITPEGTIKVLDFGLAKRAELHDEPASAPTASHSLLPSLPATDEDPAPVPEDSALVPEDGDPATGHGLTRPGTVRGTPRYMSPEQLRGAEAGPQSDIWSFGCILFECLTGLFTFNASSMKGLFAAISLEEPCWDILPPSLPPVIGELIRGCLRKPLASRLRDMTQVRLILEQAASGREDTRRKQVATGNLPRELTSFIGRESELEELSALLRSTSLLTLTGSGGSGKSRLALRLAWVVRDTFPDGAWMVELAALREQSLVTQAVAASLGLQERRGERLEDTIAGSLGASEVLLVLDNCEHVLGACAELAGALLSRCPGLRILASSREGLGLPGERIYQVPSLRVADPRRETDPERLAALPAVQLFVERAREVRPSFSPSPTCIREIAQVCHRLDGIPLAIELAAAKVRILSASQIAARLDDRFRLLTGGARTALPRQQTLRALIDWSYDLLEPEEQLALRALSVFSGGWTLDAAVRVCGGVEADEFAVLDILSRLTDKSLVAVESGGEQIRYRLLETVRQYARDRMIECAEGGTFRERHLAVFADLAREFGNPGERNPKVCFDRLQREHDNIREALAFCLGHETHHELAVSMATQLRVFWMWRGFLSEGRDVLELALDQPEPISDQVRVAALDSIGRLSMGLGDYERAISHFGRARKMFSDLGDRRGEATSVLNAGIAHWRIGDLHGAEPLLVEALQVQRQLDDREAVADTLRSVAIVKYRQGDMLAATGAVREATGINRELGRRQQTAVCLQLEGLISFRVGNFTSSRELHEEALEIMRTIGYRPGVAMQLINLGNLSVEEGDHGAATRVLEEALAIAREVGRRQTIVEALGSLAECAYACGDPARARQHFEETLAICEDMHDSQGVARSKNRLARLDMEDGELERAASLYLTSVRLFHTSGNLLELEQSLWGCCDLARSQGHDDLAAQILASADAMWERAAVDRPPSNRTHFDRHQESLRADMGEERYRAAREMGQERTILELAEQLLHPAVARTRTPA